MEPLTALLAIAASYGASALVKTLGGGTDLSSLAGDLVKALADSESRIDERLTSIELKLDELLEQRYKVALRAGVRYLLDAIPAPAVPRAHDLDRARDAFVEAQASARSSLQAAVAERYLLLCSLGLQRTELAMSALTRVEGLAVTAAFEAMVLTEYNRAPAAALMQREGSSLRQAADRDRRRRAQLLVRAAALDTIGISGRLLGEAAIFAPAVGLPPRVTPPSDVKPTASFWHTGGRQMSRWIIDQDGQVDDPGWTVDDRGRTVDKHGQALEGAHPLLLRPATDVRGSGLWRFTIRSGETLRIGPLAVQIHPGPVGALVNTGSVHIDLAWPLPLPLRIEVTTAGRRRSEQSTNGELLAATAAEGEVHIPQNFQLGSPEPCWLSISPENVYGTLIEVRLPDVAPIQFSRLSVPRY
jgi:hypothetical protein